MNGRDIDLPTQIIRVGNAVWSHRPSERGTVHRRKDQSLPAFGVPEEVLDDVADGLTQAHEVISTTPEVLRPLTPDQFTAYLINDK